MNPKRQERRVWVSECGRFYAVRAPRYPPAYDVLEIDGDGVWLERRYKYKGWKDSDRRATHPEFPRMIGGWSNLGRTKRTGEFVPAFELDLLMLDQRKRIRPGYGNTVLAEWRARFFKQRRVSLKTWCSIRRRIWEALKAARSKRLAQESEVGI